MVHLTQNRERVLREAVVKGWSGTPGGYKTAWRDARHWWSAVEWLATAGLVERPTGAHGCRPTAAGRILVAELDTINHQAAASAHYVLARQCQLNGEWLNAVHWQRVAENHSRAARGDTGSNES